MRRLAVGMAILALAGVAISWAMADDKEIAREITERLKGEQEAGNLDGFDINLKVAQGQVLLKGHVSTPEQQELALDIARKADGVKRVVNDLTIGVESSISSSEPPALADKDDAATPDDGTVAAALAQSLRTLKDSGDLKGFRISFDVTDGKVVMKGTVSSDEQRELALRTARGISGVKNVADELIIRNASAETAARQTPAMSDTEIAQQIAAALKERKDAGELSCFAIDLTVDQGVAVLAGSVANSEQSKLAAQTARSTEGVNDVVNKLVVAERPQPSEQRGEPTPAVATLEAESTSRPDRDGISDTDIARKIAGELRELKQRGTLSQFNIDLSVENGILVYEGRVSNADQIELAMEVARNTNGVRDIVNHLVVAAPESELVAQRDAESNTDEARSSDSGFAGRFVSAGTDMLRSRGQGEAAEYAPTPAEPMGQAANAIYQPGAQNTLTPDVVAQDQRIGEELIEKLQRAKQQGGLRGFGIGVHVSDGTVRLAGRVPSLEQQNMALEIARRIRGVRVVVNELKVVEPAADEPIDRDREAIAREIGERLQAEDGKGNLRGCDFDVKVSEGDVWLSGTVASKEQEELALEAARGVPGVERAMSALKIASPEATLANVGVSTTTASLRPSIGQPARLGISPSVPADRMASAGSLPAVAPTAAQVTYPAAQPATPGFATANQTPRPLGLARLVSYPAAALALPLVAARQGTGAMPAHLPGPGHSTVPARYDHPNLPGYAWPSYSAYPNYAGVTYPKQYSPTAWPYIGPFYPYPQVPLGWRRMTLKWDDGWWQLNFKSK